MRAKRECILSGSLLGCLLACGTFSLSARAQNTAANEWTWMGGSTTYSGNCGGGCAQPGVYGTLGESAAGNIPGSREFAATWTDLGGNLWLFGGYGADAIGRQGDLNDLWEFNPSTNEWAWMGGSNAMSCDPTSGLCRQLGVYGTLGAPAAGNIPTGRHSAASWIDGSGNFWLFGGLLRDGDNGQDNYLNDLWEYNPSKNEWTWMAGGNSLPDSSSEAGQPGVYGTIGTPAVGNTPGGRIPLLNWTDPSGNYWFVGGYGVNDDATNIGDLDDMWEFNPVTNEWTWVDGLDVTSGAEPSVYSPPMASPGSRAGETLWTSAGDYLWLFGGGGIDAYGVSGYLNDLWTFKPSNSLADSLWTWVGGSDKVSCATGGQTICGGAAVYGLLDTPAIGNLPGGREATVSWVDGSGNLWLFGGAGFDSSGTTLCNLDDLWEYSQTTKLWAWMAGNDEAVMGAAGCGNSGKYGKLGIPDGANNPEGRSGAVGWTGSNGNFWLFGGYGINSDGASGLLNDLWEYQPSAPLPPAAVPTFSEASPWDQSSVQTVTISDATAGAVIYYNTNGSTLNTNSPTYTSPITTSLSALQAFAAAPSYSNSAINSGGYIPYVPNFTVSSSLGALTLDPGRSATFSILVNSTAGFSSQVALTCIGLPQGATCSFSPTIIAPGPNGLPGTTALTVAVSGTSAFLRSNPIRLFPGGSALAAAVFCLRRKKLRRLPVLLLLLWAGIVGVSALDGCGGGASSAGTSTGQPTTSTITVIGTSGSLQHSTTFQLTVN